MSQEEWVTDAIVALRPFANLAESFKIDDQRAGLSFTTPNLSPRDFHRAKAVFDRSPPCQDVARIDRYVRESQTVFDRRIREEERDRFVAALGRKYGPDLTRSPYIEEICPTEREWASCETAQARYDLMKRRVRRALALFPDWT